MKIDLSDTQPPAELPQKTYNEARAAHFGTEQIIQMLSGEGESPSEDPLEQIMNSLKRIEQRLGIGSEE